jgi:hypothetical protein
MVFVRELAVRLLDFIGACAPFDAHRFVIVLELHRAPSAERKTWSARAFRPQAIDQVASRQQEQKPEIIRKKDSNILNVIVGYAIRIYWIGDEGLQLPLSIQLSAAPRERDRYVI